MLLRALVKQEGKQYWAHCLEIDAYGKGYTPADAIGDLRQRLEFYLKDRDGADWKSCVPDLAVPETWQEFFEREDEGQPDNNISFYSVIIKEDGSRVLQYPF